MDERYTIDASETSDALGLLMNERLAMPMTLSRPIHGGTICNAAAGTIAAYIKMADANRVQDDLAFLLDTTPSLANVAALFIRTNRLKQGL
jgi:hypothetical protein